MMVELHFITGVMLGIEYVNLEDSDATHLILDLGIVRIMFTFFKGDSWSV